ncbi:Plasma kallikrein [Apis cerana cerana]|uniref:Plasma kallikrein n=1 Tax=Apis cerana cerana TaxID=94128 RepID=A0A2A3E1F4_APICC|nr:Plasma kallikrein [Apis cerana cerana]
MIFTNNIAAFQNVILAKKVKIVLLIFYGSIMFSMAQVNKEECDYYQNLNLGETYYIYNPTYPFPYSGPKCTWTITSYHRINLKCSLVEFSKTKNCDKGSLTVKKNFATKYCGNITLNVESTSNKMIVILSPPGRFFCEVQPIKRVKDSTNCNCGWKNPSRIVGGINTGINEFPMMAGIKRTYETGMICGATIISKRYVLTAAHCVTDENSTELAIVVGEHDWSSRTETKATVLHSINKVIIHPNYDVIEKDDWQINDIALLKTEKDIKFDDKVGPACLPFQHFLDSFAGSDVTVLGWGHTSFKGKLSRILQKATLSMLTQVECHKYYGNIMVNAMCAYAKGKDACQMDSGGPVLWQNPRTKRLVNVGITSWGAECGKYPAGNTKVGSYIDWIVSQTPDAEYCVIE